MYCLLFILSGLAGKDGGTFSITSTRSESRVTGSFGKDFVFVGLVLDGFAAIFVSLGSCRTDSSEDKSIISASVFYGEFLLDSSSVSVFLFGIDVVLDILSYINCGTKDYILTDKCSIV